MDHLVTNAATLSNRPRTPQRSAEPSSGSGQKLRMTHLNAMRTTTAGFRKHFRRWINVEPRTQDELLEEAREEYKQKMVVICEITPEERRQLGHVHDRVLC